MSERAVIQQNKDAKAFEAFRSILTNITIRESLSSIVPPYGPNNYSEILK